MDVVNWFLDGYNSVCEYTDPRIIDWPLVKSPVIPGSIILSYLLFVYLGPKWMASRKQLEMQNILIVYNFGLVVINLYTVYEFLMGGWLFEYSLGCQPVDFSNNPTALRMARAIYMFYIVKFIELLDTVFFILRKKNNQVTFLHVFHHSCLPMFWWYGVKEGAGGFGTFHALINAMVHVVMYFYYGLAGLGPKYQKYLWWKRYVTVFQLAQFFIVTIHNSQYLFMECAYPRHIVAYIQLNTTIIAALFLNFYIKTYRKASSKRQDTGNGTIKKEHAQRNGYVNGHSGDVVKNGNGLKTD